MILNKNLYLRKPLLARITLVVNFFTLNLISLFRLRRFSVRTVSKLGHPILTLKDNGDLQCNACGLCPSLCPTKAIILDVNQQGQVQDFHLDLMSCTKCGLCVQACPIDAIRMGHQQQSAKYSEDDWMLSKLQLTQDQIVSRHG